MVPQTFDSVTIVVTKAALPQSVSKLSLNACSYILNLVAYVILVVVLDLSNVVDIIPSQIF